jgi:peptidoglycan-N-acetylglucosamine deacetylase
MTFFFFIFLLFMLFFPFLYIVLPELISRLLRHRFKARLGFDKTVFLTFDDGPDPVFTPKILDRLSELGITATFFVLHTRAEKYPEIMKRIIDDGHAVGSHGIAHSHPWYNLPLRFIFRDIQGFGVVQKKYMIDQFMYRPPFGKMNLIILVYVFLRHAKLIWWTLDPQDYDKPDSSSIVDAVLSRLPRANSQRSVSILLHDGSYKNIGSFVSYTSEAITPLCQHLAAFGYDFAAFSKMSR